MNTLPTWKNRVEYEQWIVRLRLGKLEQARLGFICGPQVGSVTSRGMQPVGPVFTLDQIRSALLMPKNSLSDEELLAVDFSEPPGEHTWRNFVNHRHWLTMSHLERLVQYWQACRTAYDKQWE